MLSFHSVRLGLNFIHWKCLSPHDVMNRILLIIRFWKHKSCHIWRKCVLSTSQLQESSRWKKSKWVLFPSGVLNLLEISKIPARFHKCYRCFCSTLVSMLSTFYLIYLSKYNTNIERIVALLLWTLNLLETSNKDLNFLHKSNNKLSWYPPRYQSYFQLNVK